MNTNVNNEDLQSFRSIMNKGDILGMFDEYLEEKNVYAECDSYDEIIHKIIELKNKGKNANQILDEIIVFMDDEYEFHPDKDLDDDELSDSWREDMEDLIKSIIE